MVTKAQQRINKAKRKYPSLEPEESSLTRLIHSPYTLSILIVAALCGLGLWLA